MARVTVEDCIKKVPSHFELVLLAGRRARTIESNLLVDKKPVVALREIADGVVDPETLRSQVINSHRQHVAIDDEEREMANLLSNDQGSRDANIGDLRAFEEELDDVLMHSLAQQDAQRVDEDEDLFEEELEEDLDPESEAEEDV